MKENRYYIYETINITSFLKYFTQMLFVKTVIHFLHIIVHIEYDDIDKYIETMLMSKVTFFKI